MGRSRKLLASLSCVAALAGGAALIGGTALSQAVGAAAPAKSNVLLCGLWTQGADRIAGQSVIDHPSGASATGQQYAYTGQNCESEFNGSGGFSSGSGSFVWTIGRSNVNTTTERGTEHGRVVLGTAGGKVTGFQGHITNYDFGTPITTVAPDTCGTREIFYASGHTYDSGTCSPSGPGNFNTRGGAATGQHFRGTYGTVVFQTTNNNTSPCDSSGTNYCFESILKGQTN